MREEDQISNFFDECESQKLKNTLLELIHLHILAHLKQYLSSKFDKIKNETIIDI